MLDDSLDPCSEFEENASADDADDADDSENAPSVSFPLPDLCPSAPSADESVSLAAELLTEAQAREDALAARIRLGLEAVAALRSAQAPAEGEDLDPIDRKALGRTIRRYLDALEALALPLGRWGGACTDGDA